jgi:hypothetical protein
VKKDNYYKYFIEKKWNTQNTTECGS